MAVYEPPNNYFTNINFNSDFYQIPNDELNGISAAYADKHYLQISQGTRPKSAAISSDFTGTISEGNILLSTKYQSNLYAIRAPLPRQYPPLSLNTNPTTNITSASYGNGNYTTTASSFLSATFAPFRAFVYPFNTGSYWATAANDYFNPSSTYAGPFNTVVLGGVGNVNGEWIQIQFPSKLFISSYTIVGMTAGGNFANPVSWRLVVSTDGTNWYNMDSRSGITGWSAGTNVSLSFIPTDANINVDWNYCRLIVTQVNGTNTLNIQQLSFSCYNPATDNAISTSAIAIGTTNIAFPTTLLVTTGNASFTNRVGIGRENTSFSLDILSTTGIRLQHTNSANGFLTLTPGSTTNALGSINFFDSIGSNGSIGGPLVNGSYINMNSVFGVTQGYSVSGNFIVNSNCIVGGTTFNTNATFDVGGTAATTRYSFLNGLRISGRDANTIWQDITTSNINITTSGTAQNIGFNIGNGNNVGIFNSSGLQLPLTKGIGVGTAPPAYSGVDIFGVSSPLVSISGSNCRIALNADNVRLAYVTTAGVYSTGSLVNDFVVLNMNGRILFNPNAAPYAHCIMSTSGLGATTFHSTVTGAQGAIITGSGAITCTSITADGATVKNSLSLTGGTPSTLTSPINASAGTQVSNYVTVAPNGYLLWGGGNNSGVVAFSANTGTQFSIRADYAIIGNGFISFSDKRIKRDIKPIENSLEIVDKIEPKNYNIIETAENRYGFIAQEVEEVIPSAVKLAYDFIPNIFDFGDYDDKVITFDNKNGLELVEGDEVKINNESCRVEEVIDKNSFRIHKKLEVDENKKVFILGSKVKDFKCINYDMITSINTAAIKELYSIIKQQQEQIAFLMTKIGVV